MATQVVAQKVLPEGKVGKVILAAEVGDVVVEQLEYLIEHFRLSGWNEEHRVNCTDCRRFGRVKGELMRAFEE